VIKSFQTPHIGELSLVMLKKMTLTGPELLWNLPGGTTGKRVVF
jgi:hypothetical protein